MSSTAVLLLFVVVPYAAIVLAVVGSAVRLAGNRYSISALSSQFLESRRLFWGSVAFHYGILVILAAHLAALLIPGAVRAASGTLLRLYVLEATGLAFGILALLGLVVLAVRRLLEPRLRVVTSRWDVVLLLLLVLQVATGVYTAVFARWGLAWSLHTAVPYLWSLVRLSPEPALVAGLPWAVKLHILNAFALIAVIPFTRLIHFLFAPVWYLWRPYQLVVWNRRRETGRAPIAASSAERG